MCVKITIVFIFQVVEIIPYLSQISVFIENCLTLYANLCINELGSIKLYKANYTCFI